MRRSSRFAFVLAASLAAAPSFARLLAEETTAAVVAGASVPLSDVDQAAADRLFSARRDALEEIAGRLLMAKEAESRGITVDALIKAEITDKTPAPTEASVREFYEQNKERMGGKPFEELSSSIEKFLQQQASAARGPDFIRALKNKYGMRVSLQPRRVAPAPSDSPSRGPKDAPVTLIEFSDYQCPFCAKTEETIKRLEALYGKDLRVVFRDFPLTMHKDAPRAAEAAACAEAGGRFWPYHDLLFANQDKLSDDGLIALAVQAGLKKERFAKCLAEGKYAGAWRKDADEGRRLGATGTPTLIINGRFLFGNLSFEAFEQIIDDELLLQGKPLPGVETSSGKKG